MGGWGAKCKKQVGIFEEKRINNILAALRNSEKTSTLMTSDTFFSSSFPIGKVFITTIILSFGQKFLSASRLRR